MTDQELLSRVLACIDPPAHHLRQVKRKGRVLLGLPTEREAAARALGLYQPQRAVARLMVTGLRCLARLGLHGGMLSKIRTTRQSGAPGEEGDRELSKRQGMGGGEDFIWRGG